MSFLTIEVTLSFLGYFTLIAIIVVLIAVIVGIRLGIRWAHSV